MRFDERFVEDRLRTAEQTEIVTSDQMLFADLHMALTPDRLQEGVGLDFGDQREQLESVIDALGISALLWDRSDMVHVHNVVVDSGSTTSYLGGNIEEIGNMSILDVLDVLQADHWTTYLERDTYPTMRPKGEVITSKILLANTFGGEEGEKFADTELMGVVIGVANRYLPNFNNRRKGLSYFFRDTEEVHGSFQRNVVGPLLAEMAVSGLRLSMPDRRFFLKIGALRCNPLIPTGTLENVSTAHRYTVAKGRLL